MLDLYCLFLAAGRFGICLFLVLYQWVLVNVEPSADNKAHVCSFGGSNLFVSFQPNLKICNLIIDLTSRKHETSVVMQSRHFLLIS